MNIDHIVKEELLRSFPVLFVSFLIIGLLNREGYIPLEMSRVFILALFVTAVHFFFMVWYRKKEQLLNPSIFSIIGYVFESRSYEEKTIQPHENEEISIFFSIRKKYAPSNSYNTAVYYLPLCFFSL